MRPIRTSSLVLGFALSASGALAPPMASAQQAAEAAASLDEVVVSARRREEKLQDIPLSITALSADTLVRSGVRTIRDVAQSVAGLSMVDFGQGILTTPVMRGMTQANTAAAEGSVSVFLDGVYILNNNALDVALTDVERIEVLRGPQSTQYGRNSFAGAINYVTRAPSSEWEASVRAELGNYSRADATATVSGPILGESLRARFALLYNSYDGTWRDRVSGVELGGSDRKGAQASLQWTPSDAVTVDAAAYYALSEFAPSARAFARNCGPVTVPAAAPAEFRGPNYFCGRWPDGEDLDLQYPAVDVAPEQLGNKVETTSLNLRPRVELPFGELSAILATNDNRVYQFAGLDRQRNGAPFLVGPAPFTPANPLNRYVLLNQFVGAYQKDDDQSLELRYATPSDRRVRAEVGGFSYETDRVGDTLFSILSSNLPAGFRVIPTTSFLNAWLSPTGSPFPGGSRSVSNIEQRSLFASIEADVTERIRLRGEVRRTEEEKLQNQLTGIAPGFPDPDGINGVRGDWDYDDWRLSAQYLFSPDLQVYASAATGTRAGGFNPTAQLIEDLQYDPERNTTYEIGLKSSWLERRLVLNVAAYAIDWEDIQLQAPPSPAAVQTGATVVRNLGQARVSGVEVELSAQPVAGLRLDAAVSYSDPKFDGAGAYDTANAASCLAIPTCAPRVGWVDVASGRVQSTPIPGATRAVALDGQSLHRQSDWLLNLSADYEAALRGDWQWYGRADLRYESEQFGDIIAQSSWGARKLLGARLGVRNERYDLAFWGRNLLDDTTVMIQGASAFSGLGITVQNVNLGDRRTYGIALSARF
jgi:iron complex outermembrane receptor protein